MEKINSKEQKLHSDPFFDWHKRVMAQQIFNDFVKRVKNNEVKNDGSDKFLSIIDEYVLNSKNNSFYKTLKKKTSLYRARIVEAELISKEKGFNLLDEGIGGFSENESREAPLGVASEGRNNIKGVSYFYASKKPETACCEVKPGIRQLVSVAEFETKETLHIIDFSTNKAFDNHDTINLGRLFTDIMFSFFRPILKEEEYRATQVLTDYIRKTGIDGICYRSFYDETGINYTIFNSDHRKLKYKSSRLFLFQSERKTFLDINKKKTIQAESVGGASYDSKTRDTIYGNIIGTLNKK